MSQPAIFFAEVNGKLRDHAWSEGGAPPAPPTPLPPSGASDAGRHA